MTNYKFRRTETGKELLSAAAKKSKEDWKKKLAGRKRIIRMKQTTQAVWRTELSPRAETKLDAWLRANNLFSRVEDDTIPFTQLTIGQLIQFLFDQEDGRQTVKDIFVSLKQTEELLDVLAEKVREILEQKN